MEHTSSDESSDEGPDVYVPSFTIPSRSISHDEPFTSPDLENKSDDSFEVEQRSHDYTEDGDRGHSDIEVEKSNVGAESDQNIHFKENDKSNGDQNELSINESKELLTDIKQKPDAGNTDFEGMLWGTETTNMMNQCTSDRKTSSEHTEVTEDSIDMVGNCVSEKDKSNEEISCKTEHVLNKKDTKIVPTPTPRKEILYNRQHSNPGFQYGGQFQNMYNIPPSMPYYPPPLPPNHFYNFQPCFPVRPDWNYQHVQQSKLLDVQPAVSECKGDNSPDLISSKSTSNYNSMNQKDEKKENTGRGHVGNYDTFTGKTTQKDNTKEKEDHDELNKNLFDSQRKTYASDRHGSQIFVTFSGDISEHTLTYYFENTRKSGGGEIQKMDFSPDTGVAVIVFDDAESAANVLKKNEVHRVSDVNLKIHLIKKESDLASVLEENMVLVKGINLTTTEDCLWDYLGVKTKCEPTDIKYGSDTTCALVRFEDKIDFGKLQEGCRIKPLESHTLTVSRVPVTSSVLVTGFNSEVSRDAVQYYFENERRSGGDENLEMVEFDSTACVIRFLSPLVAKRVCNKKEQKIGCCLLDVCLYYDFLGQKKNVEKPDPEILSADYIILKFLKNSAKLKLDFENKLKNLNASVEWATDFENEETKITCDLDLTSSEGQKGVSTWGTKVTEFTDKFMASFTSIQVTSLRESWEDVKKGLRSLNVSDPDKVCVILEPNNHAITIVGDKSVVTDLYRKVQKIVSDAEGKASQKNHSSTKTISYKIYKLQLLWRLKCFDTLMERFPGVDAQCNLDKREVTLSGDIEKMQAAELYLRETENSFVRKPFKMSKNKKDLLFKKGARDIWYQETKKKQIIATWNVDHGACEMYAQTNEEVERAIISMVDLFLEDEILDSDKFTQSSVWEKLLEKLNERDQNCFVIKTFHGKIQLAATKYIFHEIKSDIEKEMDEYAKEQGRRAEKISYLKSSAEGKRVFVHNESVEGNITQLKVDAVNSANNDMDHCGGLAKVIVDVVSEKPLKYPGKNTGMTGAMVPSKYLHSTEQIYSRNTDMRMYPQHTEPSMYPRHTDMRMNSQHTEPSMYPRHTDMRTYRQHTETRTYPHHTEQRTASTSADFITVVKGLLTERQVDVIVNSVSPNLDLSHGRLSGSILMAAGDIIQTEIYQHIDTFKPYKTVVATSGGKMNCTMIIHGTLSPFDSQDGTSILILQLFIDNCLRTSAEKGMRSIAFPAVGTGVLKFPVDIVAKVMFERVIAFKKKYPDSSIQKVEFVIFPQDTATIKAFDSFQQRLTGPGTSHGAGILKSIDSLT